MEFEIKEIIEEKNQIKIIVIVDNVLSEYLFSYDDVVFNDETQNYIWFDKLLSLLKKKKETVEKSIKISDKLNYIKKFQISDETIIDLSHDGFRERKKKRDLEKDNYNKKNKIGIYAIEKEIDISEKNKEQKNKDLFDNEEIKKNNEEKYKKEFAKEEDERQKTLVPLSRSDVLKIANEKFKQKTKI
jgi:hypothetical protein